MIEIHFFERERETRKKVTGESGGKEVSEEVEEGDQFSSDEVLALSQSNNNCLLYLFFLIGHCSF